MRKPLGGFIFEMIINIFLIAAFCAFLFTTQVKFKFEFNIISIGCYVLIACLVLWSLKSIKIGLKASIDLLFKKTIKYECTVLSQIPYECTWVFDKFDEDRHIISPIRFCVTIKQTKGNIVSLVSPNFIECDEKKCVLLVAKFSHIVIGKVDA